MNCFFYFMPYWNKMSPYQQEQIDALQMVLEHLQSLSELEQRTLADLIAEYLVFRQNVDEFLSAYLADVCTLKCYKNRLSACCSKEGIITFFADVVVNALVSSEEETRLLARVLEEANKGFKCIYLGADGCLWHLKPIVCEMFICDDAQKHILNSTPEARQKWEEFKQLKRHFTWPDRPVLFDALEAIFIKAGDTSPLMYLHNSPGLLRVKQRANLKCAGTNS
ncbi:MAG: hypothetical protein OET21_08080 [Desulfobacterales bacterium]|nr:hypothetical protein [Desulfobacterales bacterium]